ncbi:unnamed protein product [Closterium sp. NIES-64]|nr:unnamed protein product [Closterium sp. NIES-64]
MARSTTWPDICALRCLPNRRTLFLTLCDLSLPLVQETLAALPERQTCDPTSGFFHKQTLARMRDAVRLAFYRLLPNRHELSLFYPRVRNTRGYSVRKPVKLPPGELSLPEEDAYLTGERKGSVWRKPESGGLGGGEGGGKGGREGGGKGGGEGGGGGEGKGVGNVSGGGEEGRAGGELGGEEETGEGLVGRWESGGGEVGGEEDAGDGGRHGGVGWGAGGDSLGSKGYGEGGAEGGVERENRGDGEGGREGVEGVGRGGDVHEWVEREEEMQEEDTEGGPLLAMYGGDVGEEDRGEEGEEGREDGRKEDREEDREDGREGEEKGGLFVDDGEGEGATMGDDVWAMGAEEGGDGEGRGRGGGQAGEGEERGEEEDEEDEENEMVMGEEEEDGEYSGRQADETTQTEERAGAALQGALGALGGLGGLGRLQEDGTQEDGGGQEDAGMFAFYGDEEDEDEDDRQEDRQIDCIGEENRWGAAGMGQQHDYQYKHFKATVPERQISVGVGNQLRWRYYDFGPKAIPPLLCLGGVAATADAFHKQVLALAAKGFRVIAADPPPVWSHQQWIKAVDQFLDALRVHQVHLYGTSLGGFLFQLYAQQRPRRVLSLVLSNSFFDTHFFNVAFGSWSSMFPYSPDFVLKRLVLSGLRDGPHEPLIADSIDFVVSRLDSLSRAELASRLTLNTLPAVLPPLQQMPEQSMTLMDCNDFAAVAWQLRDALYTRYPNATRAFLKSGGDFPFLSRADEVNLHLFLHLRRVDAEREPGHTDILAPTLPAAVPESSAAASAASAASVASAVASTAGDASSGLADSHAHALAAPAGSSAGAVGSAASSFTSAASVFSSSIPSVPHDLPSSSSSSLPLSTPALLEHHASPLASANPFDPLSPPLDPLGLAWQGSPLQPPPPLVPALPGTGFGAGLGGGGVGEAVRGVSGSSSDVTAGEDDGEEATSAAAQALEGTEGEVLSREGTTGGPLAGEAEERGVREEEAGGEAGQGNESEEEEEEEESDAAQFRSQASNWLRFVEPEHYGEEEEGGSRAEEEEGEEKGEGVEEVSEGVERLAVGDSPLG